MEEEEMDLPQILQKESIKLIKASKGYRWEIKILETDIERIADLNKKMEDKFGDSL